MSAKVTVPQLPLFTSLQAVHFYPPLEERNPELVIVKQEKTLLKQVLSEKHVPLHKVLNQRPQTAGSQRASSAQQQHQQRQFTMYTSKTRERKLRITHEKNRKAKIINDRIQCVNKVDTYIKLGTANGGLAQSRDLRRDLSPSKALQLVNSVLNLQVKRENKENEEKHLRVMRGSTSEWQRHLRLYETKDRVFVPSKSRSRSPQKAFQDQKQERNHHPIMKEQQVQTIKSVFRPTQVDEQLSAFNFH